MHDRSMALRLLAAAAALLLVFTAVACGPSHSGAPSAPGSSHPSSQGAISIPTGNLDPVEQCMLDNGWQVSAVHSSAPGQPPTYEMARVPDGKTPDEVRALTEKCWALATPPPAPTEAEARVVYDRWVGEYQCLVGLGYQPDPPPSFEVFLPTYTIDGDGIGPWMPTDGLDTIHWTQAQIDEAKAKCTLEFWLD